MRSFVVGFFLYIKKNCIFINIFLHIYARLFILQSGPNSEQTEYVQTSNTILEYSFLHYL